MAYSIMIIGYDLRCTIFCLNMDIPSLAPAPALWQCLDVGLAYSVTFTTYGYRIHWLRLGSGTGWLTYTDTASAVPVIMFGTEVEPAGWILLTFCLQWQCLRNLTYEKFRSHNPGLVTYAVSGLRNSTTLRLRKQTCTFLAGSFYSRLFPHVVYSELPTQVRIVFAHKRAAVKCGCYACYDWICFHNGQNSNLAKRLETWTAVHELQLYGHYYDSLTWSLIHSCTHSILFGIRKGMSLLLVDLQPVFFFLL